MRWATIGSVQQPRVCHMWVKDLFVCWWPVVDKVSHPQAMGWVIAGCSVSLLFCCAAFTWIRVDKAACGPWRWSYLPWDQTAAMHPRTERHLWHFQQHCRTEPGWRVLGQKGLRALELQRGQELASCNAPARDNQGHKSDKKQHLLDLHLHQLLLEVREHFCRLFPAFAFSFLWLHGCSRAARTGSASLASGDGEMKEHCRTWNCFLVVFFTLLMRLLTEVFLYIGF